MGTKNKLIVDPVQKDLLTACAELHVSGLNQGFLSSLGPGIMQLIFLHGAQSKFGSFIVCKRNDTVIGFLLGTLDTGQFYKNFVLKKGIKAGWILLPKIFNFSRLKKIFETLFYPSKNELRDLPRSELMDIVISDQAQGKGIGTALLNKFSDILHDANIAEFKVTTGEQLTEAAKFYKKHGGDFRGTIELHEGAKIHVYVCKTQKLDTF
ncbi:MAG: GNAT family N-acetyltransferase [Parasphingorhabdus sp.]|uniref:GNAT family N-acetyltransferase n=1 Tax=Parasphingorhabdus sp. TaxID=2709688 RepID=UPI0032987A45